MLKPEVPGLFDMPAPVCASATPSADWDEGADILAEIKEGEESEEEQGARVG